MFGLFKNNPIQKHLNDFFSYLQIVDVIATQDIPIIKIDGKPIRTPAIHFFEDYSKLGATTIDSYSSEIDIKIHLLDAIIVMELNASDDRSKQFVVLQQANKQEQELDYIQAQSNTIRIMTLKQMIMDYGRTYELILFKEFSDWFRKHQQEAVSIIKRKYY